MGYYGLNSKINIFCSFIVMSFSFFYVLARIGFAIPIAPILNITGFSLFLINFNIVTKFCFRNLNSKDNFEFNELRRPMYSFIVLLFICVCACVSGFFVHILISILSSIGFIAFFFLCVRFFANRTRINIPALFCFVLYLFQCI